MGFLAFQVVLFRYDNLWSSEKGPSPNQISFTRSGSSDSSELSVIRQEAVACGTTSGEALWMTSRRLILPRCDSRTGARGDALNFVQHPTTKQSFLCHASGQQG